MKNSENKMMITVLTVLIATVSLFSQEPTCVKQGKNLPDNDCAPCTTDTKYNVIVQNLLEVEEIYKMQAEMDKMVEEMNDVYKTFGNLKQKGFDELDLDLKKLYDEAKNDPQRAMDLISWMEGELEKGGCAKGIADLRSDGVSNGTLQSVSDNATQSIKNLTYPNYMGPDELTFDCCVDPRWQPNDVVITNALQIHNEFQRLKKSFEDFKLLHMIQINAVQMGVWQFQKYDAESKKKMEQLTNQSFCDVITNALNQSGSMNAKDAEFLNNQIKQYYKTNDMLSLYNAVRLTLGEDAAAVAQFLVENYTATDLLGNFGDLIKKNPAKLKALQKLSGPLKGAKWLSSFMNLVSYAEAAVNVFFDTFLKLGGNSFQLKAQSDLWCVAAYYYYHAMQSTLTNAAALYKMKQALLRMQKFFPSAVIPMQGLDSLTAENAEQKITSAYGLKNVSGTLQANKYIVNLPGGKTVVFVFGNFFCGKFKSYPKPETTPDPKQKKSKTGVIWEPGRAKFNTDSSIVVIDNYDGDAKEKPEWSGGFICGTGWVSNNGSLPFYNGMNSGEFVQQHQTELNSGFNGTTFAKGDEIRIITLPSAEFGLGFGCAVNHRWEVRAEITGGWQMTKAETDVRVARITPTLPPTTQQTTETVQAKSSAGFLKIHVGPQVNFGEKVQGFVGAGISTGFSAIDGIDFTAGEKTFEAKDLRVIPNAGGYINGGAKIPIGKRWCFLAEVEGRFIAVEKKFAASPGLKLGVDMKF